MTKSTRNLLVSVATILVAVAALSVSVWQGMELRRYYRLSTRPSLVMKIHQASPKVGLWVLNNGLGPAELRSMDVYVDGKLVASGPTALEGIRDRLGIADLTIEYMSRLDSGIWIQTGETLMLLEFPQVHHTPERVERFRAAFSRLRVALQYRSIYGEAFSTRDSTTKEERSQMMNWDAVTAVAAVVAAIGLLVTLALLIRQLKLMRAAMNAQTYTAALQQLQYESVREARSRLIHLGNEGKQPPEWSDCDRRQAEVVCHTYDTVAIMIRNDLLKESMILDNWGHSIVRTWDIVKPLVLQYRTERNASRIWDDYEWLAERARR